MESMKFSMRKRSIIGGQVTKLRGLRSMSLYYNLGKSQKLEWNTQKR